MATRKIHMHQNHRKQVPNDHHQQNITNMTPTEHHQLHSSEQASAEPGESTVHCKPVSQTVHHNSPASPQIKTTPEVLQLLYFRSGASKQSPLLQEVEDYKMPTDPRHTCPQHQYLNPLHSRTRNCKRSEQQLTTAALVQQTH